MLNMPPFFHRPIAQAAPARIAPPTSEHTGISVNGSAFEAAPNDVLLQQFEHETLQNVEYQTKAELTIRAKHFFHFIESERVINERTKAALKNPESTIAKQSAHMLHLMRGFWSNSTLHPADREALHQDLLGRKDASHNHVLTHASYERIFEDNKFLHAMMVKSVQGPLRQGDNRFGVEATVTTKAMSDLLQQKSADFKDLQDWIDEHRIASNRAGTHHFKSPHGANLKHDVGTQVRDELGLPVMLGTSGGASDIASIIKYTAQQQGLAMHPHDVPSQQGIQALIDATYHFMRDQVVPEMTQSSYDKTRLRLGAQPKKVDPFMMYSHSYPEVREAIELTIAQETPTDINAFRRACMHTLNLLNDLRKKQPANPINNTPGV